jgi:CHAT domain-containing protein
LEVHEVYGLDLKEADLVALSACETQLGRLTGGDELVGLQRAFIYAGTPSLVGTLWSVDDEATAELMLRFYHHLQDGVGKAAALRQAQLETMAEHPHPYFWAAFGLVGDPGAQVITPPNMPRGGCEIQNFYIGAIVLAFLALGAIGWRSWKAQRRKG